MTSEGASALELIEERTWKELRRGGFPLQAKASGCRVISENEAEIPFLKRRYRVNGERPDIRAVGREEASASRRVLILRYLLGAKRLGLTFKRVGLGDIARNSRLLVSFHRQVIRPIVKEFSDDPKKLRSRGEALGGIQQPLGDASVTLFPFPRTPVTFAIWRGDEKHPAEAQVMFDSSIAAQLRPGEVLLLARETLKELLKEV